MRRTWKPPGVVDFVDSSADGGEKAPKISEEVRAAITYWTCNGVRFRVVDIGAENLDSGEMVYEKRPRVVADDLPLFLFTGAEFGWLRTHEAAIIDYLEGGGPDHAA